MSNRLRIVVFGSSLVSDWHNPLATSARAILASMIERGHDVLFLEQRKNPWIVALLKARGAGPVRAFSLAYPLLPHRTYEIALGYERTVLFAQQVGTADALVALPGTPREMLEEIGNFRSQRVVRAAYVGFGNAEADLTLGPLGASGIDVVFGPAVQTRDLSNSVERTELALVAYEGAMAEAAFASIADLSPISIDQARELHGGWSYLPEVELPALYDRCRSVAVLGNWEDPLTWARLLLPLASGCHVFALGPAADRIGVANVTALTTVSELPDAIRASFQDDSLSRLDDRYDAMNQSASLIAAIRHSQEEKRLLRR